MTERPCIRCQHLLTLDGGQLVYCSVCGAPQIFLSEELQEQTELEVQRYDERSAAAGSAAAGSAAAHEASKAALPASRIATLRRIAGAGKGRWPLGVEYALVSSGIALGLGALGVLFAPVLFLAWLWVISAPMLTVSFYSARGRAERLSAGFAARLGLLTGILVGVSCAVVFTFSLVIARFALHNTTVDTQVAAAVAEIHRNAVAQYGNAAQPVLRLLGVPEFRVGFLLWMCTVSAVIYLVLSTTTAGLTGLLLGRRRAV